MTGRPVRPSAFCPGAWRARSAGTTISVEATEATARMERRTIAEAGCVFWALMGRRLDRRLRGCRTAVKMTQ